MLRLGIGLGLETPMGGGGSGVAAPATPTGLTATPGDTEVTLDWVLPGDATGYNLYQDGVFLVSGGNANETVVTGLTNGVTYSYTVSATNAGGESAQSGAVTATPAFPPDVNSDTTDTTAVTADTDTRTADGGVYVPVVAAWHDAVASGSTDTSDTSETTFSISQPVTPTNGGSCTKLRVYESSIAATRTVKMALYDNSNNLLGSGTASIAVGTPANGNYIEATLSSPVTVSNGTTYRVAWEISGNAGATWRYLSGQPANSSFINFSSSYAAFPQNPNTGLSGLTRKYAAGMYIQ